MQNDFVRCPKCRKALTLYISGNAEYEQKCAKCKSTVRIFSAGKTVLVNEGFTFMEVDQMMRQNKYPTVG
jgi:phage FluMu protein Com